MNEKEADKVIESNIIHINKDVVFESEKWVLKQLKKKRINDLFLVIAKIEQGPKKSMDISLEGPEDFDANFKLW